MAHASLDVPIKTAVEGINSAFDAVVARAKANIPTYAASGALAGAAAGGALGALLDHNRRLRGTLIGATGGGVIGGGMGYKVGRSLFESAQTARDVARKNGKGAMAIQKFIDSVDPEGL